MSSLWAVLVEFLSERQYRTAVKGRVQIPRRRRRVAEVRRRVDAAARAVVPDSPAWPGPLVTTAREHRAAAGRRRGRRAPPSRNRGRAAGAWYSAEVLKVPGSTAVRVWLGNQRAYRPYWYGTQAIELITIVARGRHSWCAYLGKVGQEEHERGNSISAIPAERHFRLARKRSEAGGLGFCPGRARARTGVRRIPARIAPSPSGALQALIFEEANGRLGNGYT